MKGFISRKYILICFLVLVVNSCISTKSITIEIPTKAPRELPDRIQSLVIVNRTVDEKYDDVESDSLQNIFYAQNFDVDTVLYDLQAADTMLFALGELLYESGRYDYVIPENRFLEADKNVFYTKEMSWEEAREICNTYNTDAVLAIDLYKTRIATGFGKESYFDHRIDGFVNYSRAQMVIIYDVLLKIYDPVEEKILAREFLKDTLVWEETAGSTKELFEDFTTIKQGLTEASIAVAIDFTEKISTEWRKEKRPVYVKGDDNLKHAGMLIDDDEWEQAMALWKETVNNTKSKATKSKAQFNLAIAYELSGDINTAIKWALESYNTMYSQLTYQYLELLEKRRKEIQKQHK